MSVAPPSFSEIARRIWDAIVVGAGPAGTMAAREIARRGARVLLVERKAFPRSKVCGGCFNQRSIDALIRVGLHDVFARLHAVPIRNMNLAGWRRRVTIPLSSGVIVSRGAFDAAMVEEAVNCGVQFIPETTATLEPAAVDAYRTLTLTRHGQNAAVNSSVVLAADGLGSRLVAREPGFQEVQCRSTRIGAGVILDGAPDFYEPGTIYMAAANTGYAGVVRLEDGRVNVAAALDAVATAGGIGRAVEAILAQAGFPAIEGDADWHGTIGLTRRMLPLACNRVLLLGDAAGYVEPFTGEGIAWALSSGAAVAPCALRAIEGWRPQIANDWSALYRRQIRKRQWFCRAFAGILRHPLPAKILLGAVQWNPGLAAPIVRHVQAQGSSGGTATRGWWRRYVACAFAGETSAPQLRARQQSTSGDIGR